MTTFIKPAVQRSAEPEPDCFKSASHPLTSITLLLTEQCNLRCDYCYIFKAASIMTPAIARQSVDFLLSKTDKQSQKLAICFFGGEPLLEPQLLQSTAEYALEKTKDSNHALTFSITSNATLLDQDRYELLKKYQIKPTFSLDGIGPSHDMHRKTIQGAGSFHLIEENMERMLSLPETTIRLTVTPDTVSNLYQSVLWLADKGFKRISISPVYEAKWTTNSFSEYYDAWAQLYKYQQIRKSCSRKLNIVNISKNEQKLCSPEKPDWGCGAARNMVTVDARGYVYPCHRFVGYFKSGKEQQIGHVSAGFYSQRRSYYIESNHIKSHKGCGNALSHKLHEITMRCSNCALTSTCGSNCIAVNEAMTGDAQTPDAINRIFAQIHASCHLHQFSDKNSIFVD